MQSTSEPLATPASVVAEDIWVGFAIRYHLPESTLRGAFVKSLEGLAKRRLQGAGRREFFWALQGISLQAQPGDVVGIIGKNGSGKTTLLKTLAGIWQPDRGQVDVHGVVSCLMSFGVGFRPNLSGRENVFVNGSILGLSRRQIGERLESIVELSELGAFIDAPVRTYSAGMKGRLGFSIAVHIDPDVMLLDEVLTVGDAAFRARAGSILDRLRENHKTIFLATHSLDMVRKSCTRAIWLEKGKIRLEGPAEEVARAYQSETGG